MRDEDTAVPAYEPPSATVLGTVHDLTLAKGGADVDSSKGIPIPGGGS